MCFKCERSRSARARQERVKSTPRARQQVKKKNRGITGVWARAFLRGTQKSAPRSGNSHIYDKLAKYANVCTRKSCIPAAVWQWFTENDENLACCSMPKCVFPGNGDDSSCALCVLRSSGKLQIAAVLRNGADFHSPQAVHRRNPLPAKAFSIQKCVFPEWGCDSAGAFFPRLGQASASLWLYVSRGCSALAPVVVLRMDSQRLCVQRVGNSCISAAQMMHNN